MKFKVYLRKEDFYRNGDSELWENKQYDSLPFICEINVKDSNNFIGTTINKNGVYFNVCMHTVSEPFVAMACRIGNLDFKEKETCYTDKPICPICGAEQEDDFEFSDIEEHCCDDCGALLEICRDIEITYNTRVLKKPKIVKVE